MIHIKSTSSESVTILIEVLLDFYANGGSRMKIFKIILALLSVAATFAFLRFENYLTGTSLMVAFLSYLLSSAIHLLVHESGHFIGGVASGYKLLCLQLGPMNIVAGKSNKLSIIWKGSLSGQCIMLPKYIENVRFKAYNMGGIIANVVLMIFSFVLLLMDSFLTALLFLELICVGVQKIIVNAVPHKTNSVPNDGYIIKILKKDKAIQKDYAMYLRLYGKLFLDEDISPQDFMYERKASEDEDEMLYYNEIQDILGSLAPVNN